MQNQNGGRDEETREMADSVQSSPWAWRLLASDLRLFAKTRCSTTDVTSFARDLRHLDNTSSRELHKVAVVYVARGQDDKATILANTTASEAFDTFVDSLGWPITVGAHPGYTGGLPVDSVLPYFANAQCELVFHVSTRLSADPTQKLKHLGNDEVRLFCCCCFVCFMILSLCRSALFGLNTRDHIAAKRLQLAFAMC